MLQLDVVTLFGSMFDAITRSGVTGRARERRLYELVLWNPRDFAANAYRTVDDRPYGGGPGMVMLAEPLERALAAARQRQKSSGVAKPRVLHLSPQGRLLDHALVAELAKEQGLVMLAGRYEGVDERLVKRAVDDEISIGDYVLSGGELAAMVVMDAVVRQLPGALGDAESASQDSFVNGLLDHPHYTRPEVYGQEAVPAVLLSGNHADIARWRKKQALGRTWQRRPDLLAKRTLSAEEAALLQEFRNERERKA
jgi:tRNA (guanine37-N1)-methyltransferase